MSADARTVHTDALTTLGTIIGESEARDAIHLAVEPVTAGEDLFPGQHIRLDKGVAVSNGETFGIVDPFLKGMVRKGQRFWFVIYPRQITSLRHVWEHPMFDNLQEAHVSAPNTSRAEASEKWIRDFAASIPLDYDTLMDGARDWVEDQRRGGYGEFLCFGGLLEGESVPDEFWPHYERVTGDVVDDEHRGSFFTCSC